MNQERNDPPVNEGDVLDLEIESLGDKGDGVGKIDKFVIMVPNTKTGEKVKVKISRVLRNMAFGGLKS